MKIGAVFTDYDGTIAPRGVSREASAVNPAVARPLVKLSRRVPVAMITSKDYAFVRPRTGFASAWACCGGLEVDLADGRRVVSPGAADRSGLLEEARTKVRGGCTVEEKRSREGELLGLCVDWTGGGAPGGLGSFVSWARRKRLHVDVVPGFTFVDVYSARPDKGKALGALKKLLGVKGAVLYMGDSPLDNPAFKASDVAVGVVHGQPSASLDCDVKVGFDSLGGALEGLIQTDLEWSPERLPGIEVEA